MHRARGHRFGRGIDGDLMFAGAKTANARNRFIVGLILIAAVAAIPRLILGSTEAIEYDGYWNIFIARVNDWKRFWYEVSVDPHPPLHDLLLTAFVHLGRSLLAYRALSFTMSIASVFCVGWCARKITSSEIWAWIAALAYALAVPAIVITLEVRSYALSSCLTLLSLAFLLSLANPDAARPARLRVGFALATIFACLSDYYVFFYAAPAGVLLLAWCALRRFRGERVSWIAEIATIAPVYAVMAALYVIQGHINANIQQHLLTYYYDPAGSESIEAFLLRNWKNLINLFLPWRISGDAGALIILVLVIAGSLAMGVVLMRARDAASRPGLWTILMTAAILGAIVTASIAGKYPFGGEMRQQFIVFVFSILCAVTVADRLTAAMANRGRLATAALISLAIVGIFAAELRSYPWTKENVLPDRVAIFNRIAPQPAGVYVDQWNLITFFIYHNDWDWAVLPMHPAPEIDVFRLRRGAQQMLLFRDTSEWNVRPESPAVYHRFAQSLRAGKIPEVSIFGALQSPPDTPYVNFPAMRHKIATMAREEGICVQRLEINHVGWYATFQENGCTAPELKPPRLTGSFDDTSEEIEYAGVWHHDENPQPAGQTISYSNVAGSNARLTFQGTEITWVHAKAFNSGIAMVRIDGVPRANVDLYSKTPVPQSSTTYSGLAPGRHTFEVMASGKRNSASSDRYIYIDQLLVR